MAEFKLKYFNAMGRGEAARLVFHLKGVKFDDEIVKWDKDTWQQTAEEFPFKTLPVLEAEGMVIGQSGSILRYLGHKFEMMGKDVKEHVAVDEFICAAEDIFPRYGEYIFAKEGEEKEAAKQRHSVVCRRVFGCWDSMIEKHGKGGFCVGEGATVADAVIHSQVDILKTIYPQAAFLEKHPPIKKVYDNISQHPNLLEYLKNRKWEL